MTTQRVPDQARRYRETQFHVGYTDVECKIEADRHRGIGSAGALT